MQTAVLEDLVSRVRPGVPVVFLDTGYHFAETIGTRDAVRVAYPVTLVDVTPRRTVAEQDAEEGPRLFERNPDRCCALRKVEPLERALAPYRAWITGLRRADSPSRAQTPVVDWDAKRSMVKVNPIATWSDEELDALRRGARRDRESAAAARLSVDRVRAVHPRGGAGRGRAGRPLVGAHQDRVRAARMTTLPAPSRATHLDLLESESVHVLREVAGEFERPVLLFSGGKDSIVLSHLAVKAFWPGRVPFPLLHVDTGHNFPEVLAFRDRWAADRGLRLLVASVEESIARGRVADRPGGSRNPLQTVTLLDAIAEHRFDAVFGGARRDEEKARAKERVFSLRDEFGQWDPRRQRPELWDLYNGRHRPGEHVRVFPLSNWTELDVWSYIARERIDVPEIYFAHERRVFRRDGMWLADSPHLPRRRVRSSSCAPSATARSGTSRAPARSSRRPGRSRRSSRRPRVTRITERGATRADDRTGEAAMEDRKREGYF